VIVWLDPVKSIKALCACSGILLGVWYGFEIAPFMVRLANAGHSPFSIISEMQLLVIGLCLSPTFYMLNAWQHAPRPVQWLAGSCLVALIGYLTYLALITLIVLMLEFAKAF
jgi:hypothetical protein